MNKQSISGFKRSGKAKARAKRPAPGRTRQANKIEYKGKAFDSETEFRYFRDLEISPEVKEIELQPVYKIIPSYEVECKKCGGSGRALNKKTMNLNKCGRCKFGKVTKAGAIYTADFRVTYHDGFVEVIDVKGGPVERDFGLRKKLFEMKMGVELIVVRWDKKKLSWKRG